MSRNGKKKIFQSFFTGNLVTLIIPIALIAILINFTLYNYFNNDISKKDSIIALNMTKNIESFLFEAVDTLIYMSLNVDNQEVIDVNESIDRINSVNNYFENIEIIDQYGKVTYTLSSNEGQIGYARNGETYFKYVQNNKSIYWSKPFISPVSGKATITVAIPKGSSIIVGYLNLDQLNNLTTSTISELGKGLDVAIVDSYGVYISGKDPALTQQRRSEPNFESIKELSADKESHIHFEYSGKEYMIVAMKITDPNWYLIIYDDYDLTFSTVNTLLLIFVGLFILSIINSIAASSIRAYRISKYVNEFIDKTETIASGDFKVNFDEQKFDEFERLAANFKIMVDNLKSRDAELENIAFHDRLTGLSNRAYLYSQNQWKNGSYKTAEIIGLIYLDVDNFKMINDTYGHTVGDEFLIELSSRMRECIDKEFIFSRLGGDEFVLLIPDQTNREKIERTINDIRNDLKRSIDLGDRSIFVTVSMGISIIENEDVYDIDTQMRNADTAMYVAKDEGKNSFVYYTPAMNEKINRRMKIGQNLRTGLENGEFHLVYQPLIIAEKNCVAGFEALLRWNCGALGGIGPAEFIPIAEEMGVICKIGDWVMRNACMTIKSINETEDANYIIAVNVSPIEIRSSEFLQNLDRIVMETGIKPEWLEIEITENVFLESAEGIILKLNQIKEKGIRISLDDFGTGYSSLSYLKRLPISTLKIDMEFIKDLEFDKDSVKMVESIIVMAHNLGAVVVAEGVETENQVILLKSISCDRLQGYYFSKPLEFGDAVALI